MNETLNGNRIAFVTGGSGFVGGRLIRTLVAQGWQVRALARSRSATAAVENLGAVPVPGDLNDSEALRKGMSGSKVVFHVAAMFKLWGDRKEFDAVNVEGMRTLVDAALATPSVQKIVAVSAAGVVMGDPEPMVAVDERVPRQERSFAPYTSSKADAEKILLAANERRKGFETIAIRPPMIWGKGMPMLDHMAETVKAGNWQWVDGGNQALSTCGLAPPTEEGTLKSVLSGLLATRSVKASDNSVSFGMAWTLAGMMGLVWRLFRLKGEPPITRQMLRLIGKPFTVRTDKARKELGYSPRVTWKAGIAEMTAN